MRRTLKVCSYILVYFFFLSCHKQSEKTIKTNIKFDKITYNFGKYKWERGIEKKIFFKYQNTGNNPLIITDIETSCGCTIPIWNKKPLLPNKTDSIEVMYDSRTLGFFCKTITVLYNGENLTQQLTIKGEVTYPGAK